MQHTNLDIQIVFTSVFTTCCTGLYISIHLYLSIIASIFNQPIASFVVTFLCLGRESILLTFSSQSSKTHHDLATVTESAKDLLISKVGGSTNL